MAKTRTEVTGGACGFDTIIEATSADGMCVQVAIESECPKLRRFADELGEIDAMQEVLKRSLIETTVVQAAAAQRVHTTGLVPVAVLRAVEVVAGLALPSVASVSTRSTIE